jgi:hypothetical protein
MCLQAVTQTAIAPCNTIPPYLLAKAMPTQELPNSATPTAQIEKNLRDELNKFEIWLKSQDDKDFKVKQDDQHVRVLRKDIPFAYVLHPVLKEMGLANKV